MVTPVTHSVQNWNNFLYEFDNKKTNDNNLIWI